MDKFNLKFDTFGNALTDYGIDIVLNSYYAFDANASEASRQIGFDKNTIRSYWRGLGLEVGRGILNEGIKKMIKSYYKNNGVYQRISEDTGYSVNTVSNHLRGLGFMAKGKAGRKSLSDKSLKEMSKLYLESGKDIHKIVEVFGVQEGTARRYLRKQGIKLKQERIRGERLERIVDFFYFFDGNASRVARELNENAPIVIGIWRRYGLEPLGNQIRDYRGYENALEYFKNTPKFRGKSRTQIFEMDPSLYRKLKEEGNFEKAMPKSKNPFLDKKFIDKIRHLKLEEGLSNEEIARVLKISVSSVWKYSRE